MNTNLKGEINFLIKPVSIFLAIIVIFIVVIAFGLNQITGLRTKIQSAQTIAKSLEQKVATLETVDTVLSGDVTFLDVVLPSKGAVLYGLSQVKNTSISQNVALSGLKTGMAVPVSGGVMKTSISFEVEGEEANVYSFLQAFSTMLPLMNVDKVSLNKSDSVVRATISLNVYSAEMPKRIPPVTETVKDFSNEEVKILKDVASYTLPLFVEPMINPNQAPKENPFN